MVGALGVYVQSRLGTDQEKRLGNRQERIMGSSRRQVTEVGLYLEGGRDQRSV